MKAITPCFIAWTLWSALLLPAAERVPWTTGRIAGSPLPPSPYQVRRLFDSIPFNHPVDLSAMPGSKRVWVAEESGKFWSFTPGAGTNRQLVADLRRWHRPFENVLGFTFHPGFVTNRHVFINYNEPGGRKDGSFISRFTVRPTEPPTLDPESEQVILRWFSGGHNGCTVAFGPDGFLYISTGDAADPDPPDGKLKTGQDISDFLACILRIDVNRSEGTNAYAVPADNPFVRTPGSRPEVWAFGFRNPFRMSFDAVTGDLWVGDVGWEQWEMIYRVQRGGNYGWPITEGPNMNVRRDIQQGPGPILPPMVALDHSDAASITGGIVYHGQKLPDLQGAYIYGDWETGKFWALRQRDGRLSSNVELCDTALKPTAFAVLEDELMILDYNGGIYGLVRNDGSRANEAFPRRLSESGLFTQLKPLQAAPGTIPYRIAAPQWNDHATAEWLLAIPGSDAIETSGGVGNIAGGTWRFPTNTVVARTLTLAFTEGAADSRRPIETQILHWDGQAWTPHSYRWRTDATDADLVGPAGTNDTFVVTDRNAPGGTRVTPWRFMTRAECLRCHNAWAGEALTLNWLQLGSPDAKASQLRELVERGALKLRDAPASVNPLAYPYDDTFPLADRARSWLHVNCSACHRNGAGGSAAIQVNYEKRPDEMRALDLKPLRGDFGLIHARILAAGDPFRSTLLYRISTEGAGRMPHIGSRLVDAEGARVLRDWLQSLTPAPTDPTSAAALRREIQEQLSQLSGPNRDNQEKAATALLASMNGSLALADAAGSRESLRTVVGAAIQHTNLFVRDLFQRFLPASQRRATLGVDFQPRSILTLTGDARRGRDLFSGAAQCAQCHPVPGRGPGFGPDLAVARKTRPYDRAQLLEQIVAPSKFVAPEFKLTSVTTLDHREFNGFVVRRTAEELVLKDQTLAEHRLKTSEITEVRESSLSAMPEGLLTPLTAQEAADLLEYLIAPR